MWAYFVNKVTKTIQLSQLSIEYFSIITLQYIPQTDFTTDDITNRQKTNVRAALHLICFQKCPCGKQFDLLSYIQSTQKV